MCRGSTVGSLLPPLVVRRELTRPSPAGRLSRIDPNADVRKRHSLLFRAYLHTFISRKTVIIATSVRGSLEKGGDLTVIRGADGGMRLGVIS